MHRTLAALVFVCLATSSASAQAYRLLYAPAGSDDPALRAEIAAALPNGQVDYFDARLGTPSAAQLSSYDAVYTWAPLAYSNPDLFGDRLADFYDDGGHVVLGLGCARPTGIGGRISETTYLPVELESDELRTSGGDWRSSSQQTSHFNHVDFLLSDVYEDIDHYAYGRSHGFFHYAPVVVSHLSNRVTYLNGRPFPTSFGKGDWPRLIANSARLARPRRVLVHAPSVSFDIVDGSWSLGHVFEKTTSYSEFVTKLGSGEYDAAFVAEQASAIPLAAAEALQDFVAAGGCAALSYFDLDGSTRADSAAVLRQTFGVAGTTTFSTPRTIWPWEDASILVSVPTDFEPDSTAFFDNGDALTPAPGAVAVFGFTEIPTAGEAATVVANQGRTVVNGFLFDNYWEGWLYILVPDQIEQITSRSRTLVAASGDPHQWLCRATVDLGLDTTRVYNVGQLLFELQFGTYDTILIDEASGAYDHPDLALFAEFVNSGGRILAADENLTDSIGMADLFGVYGGSTLTAPTEPAAALPAHPIFLAPHSLPGLLPLDPSMDTTFGVALNPYPTSDVIATFPSLAAPGHAAVVVANGGRTLLNGLRYEDLDHDIALEFAVNQLSFIAGSNATFVRGDCNQDGSVQLSDAIAALSVLFDGTAPSDCVAACDTNGDSAFDVADAVSLLGYLFVPGSPAPAAPFPTCGTAASTLGCDLGVCP